MVMETSSSSTKYTREKDLLVCGSCDINFPLGNIVDFMQHKKFDCSEEEKAALESKILVCQSCSQKFKTPWKMLQHAQNDHALRLYLEEGKYGAGICGVQIQADPDAPQTTGGRRSLDSRLRCCNECQTRGGVYCCLPSTMKEGQNLLACTAPSNLLLSGTSHSQDQTDVASSGLTTAGLRTNEPATQSHRFLPAGVLIPPSSNFIPGIIRSDFVPLDVSSSKAAAVVPPGVSERNSAEVVAPPRDGSPTLEIRSSGRNGPAAVSSRALAPEGPALPDRHVALTPPLPSQVAKVTAEVATQAGGGQTPAAAYNAPLPSPTSDGKPAVSMATSEDGISASGLDGDPDSKECCGSQDCGVTVVPVTHESMKKCCSAVVPKKRKRHMEIKHVGKQRRRDRMMAPASIFIDFSPTSEGQFSSDVFSTARRSSSSCSSPPKPKDDDGRGCAGGPTGSQAGAEGGGGPPPGRGRLASNKGSVIIQPGSTFSIPVSYSSTNAQTPRFSISASSSGGSRRLPTSGGGGHGVSTAPSNPGLDEAGGDHGIRASAMGTSRGTDEVIITIPNPQRMTGQEEIYIPLAGSFPFAQERTSTGSQQNAAPSIKVSPAGEREVHHMYGDRSVSEDHFAPSTSHDVSFTDSQDAAEPGTSQEARAEEDEEEQQRRLMGDFSDSYYRDDGKMSGKKRRYPTSKPFKCDQCDHAFNQRIHLKKHLSKHTGIKPFKCEQCDYSTVERSHLKVHIRVHTGEKPFKCTYCEYATAQNSTLKIHLKRHHATKGGDAFCCSDCGKRFVQRGLLETHAASEHSQQGSHAEDSFSGGVFLQLPMDSSPCRVMTSSPGDVASHPPSPGEQAESRDGESQGEFPASAPCTSTNTSDFEEDAERKCDSK